MRPPHVVLGVAPGADAAAVKKAFRAAAFKTHPDQNPGDPKAAERFAEVTAAYDAIRDGAPAAASSGGPNVKWGFTEARTASGRGSGWDGLFTDERDLGETLAEMARMKRAAQEEILREQMRRAEDLKRRAGPNPKTETHRGSARFICSWCGTLAQSGGPCPRSGCVGFCWSDRSSAHDGTAKKPSEPPFDPAWFERQLRSPADVDRFRRAIDKAAKMHLTRAKESGRTK